jgi:hypothetical protein
VGLHTKLTENFARNVENPFSRIEEAALTPHCLSFEMAGNALISLELVRGRPQQTQADGG